MAFEISRFLSVKYTIMFKSFLIAVCLSYISAAPVSSVVSSYEEFLNYLMQNKCDMPEGINLPYPTSNEKVYLEAPLKVCQKDDTIQRKETLYLCREAFQAVKNITCSSVNIVPVISVPLSPDVCQDFANLHELIPKSSTSIGARLADTLICNIICADELIEVCKFLLWTYQVQYKIATFQADGADAKVNAQGQDLQTFEKNKTAEFDSGKRSALQKPSGVSALQNLSGVNVLKVNSSSKDFKSSLKQNDNENTNKIPGTPTQVENDPKKDNDVNLPKNEKVLSVKEQDKINLKQLSQNGSDIQHIQDSSVQAPASIPELGDNDLNGDVISRKENSGIGIENQVSVTNRISERPVVNNKKSDKMDVKLKPDANDQNEENFETFEINGHAKQDEHNKNIKVKTSSELTPLPQDTKISKSDPNVGDITKNKVSNNFTKDQDSENDGKKIILAGNMSTAVNDKEKLHKGTLSEQTVEENKNVKPNTDIKSGTEAEHNTPVQLTEDISSSPSKSNPELSLIPTTIDVPLEQMEGENDNHPSDKEYNIENNEGDVEGEYSKSDYDGALEQTVKHKELDSKVPSPVIITNEVTLDRSSIDKPFDNFPSRNSMGRGMPDDIPMISSLPDQEDSHFFFYFLSIVLILMAGYLIVHNKQKIIALIVEGRHERRRRSHGVGYKKLETK